MTTRNTHLELMNNPSFGDMSEDEKAYFLLEVERQANQILSRNTRGGKANPAFLKALSLKLSDMASSKIKSANVGGE